MIKALRRLSDHDMHEMPMPWEFVPPQPIPEEVRADKKERHAWVNRPSTDHQIYSGNVGINDNLRISLPKGDGEGNPVHLIKFLVADYDHNAERSLVIELAKKLPHVPNYVEHTLSGNWRFVWVLERPIRVPSYSFAKHFYKSFDTFAFDVSRGMIGFDRPAWEAPERLWTNGCDWETIHETPIGENISQGWLLKAAEKFEFSQREFGPSIPLEVVREALAAKYLSFAQWETDFAVGNHGPTFWIPASKSPASATVYENGLRTFSENATKTFYSWADLLGIAFVKDHQAEAAGRAAKDILYDGRLYWRKFPDGVWRNEESAIIARHLTVQRGVSKKSSKDTPVSEVERVMDFITGSQRIDFAVPAVFRPSGFWVDPHGRRLLNTSRVQVMQPADGTAVWGKEGQFPWLSWWFEYVWEKIQMEHLLSWAHYGYKHAYEHKPRSGQILFVAGPPNVGKTLLNRRILGRMFGGHAEAGPWLMGDVNFNGELFLSGFWVIDDNSPSSDAGKRRQWSFAIKKMAANKDFQFNAKFKDSGQTEWMGRVCVTMNCDEESVRLLPDLELSILEKLLILRTKNVKVPFPKDLEQILDRELPWLARYLLQYEIPEHIRGDVRFGLKEYADPTLVDTARQSSSQAGFSELLENWKLEYFADNKNAKSWTGTGTELYMAIGADPRRSMALGKMSPDSVGRHLSSMKNKGCVWVEVGSRKGSNRQWIIWADENRKPSLDKQPT